MIETHLRTRKRTPFLIVSIIPNGVLNKLLVIGQDGNPQREECVQCKGSHPQKDNPMNDIDFDPNEKLPSGCYVAASDKNKAT